MLTYWKFIDELIPLVTKSMEVATDETNQLQLYSSLSNANRTTRAKPHDTFTPGVYHKGSMPYLADNQLMKNKKWKENYNNKKNYDVNNNNRRKNEHKDKRNAHTTKYDYNYNNPFYSTYVNDKDDNNEVNDQD